ncbi:MAG: ACT domain-containing protein, partial [Alphaproteobacteria bacterium]|nr:ACT domain-containing protein [Alphaproteobacteria bacterium]
GKVRPARALAERAAGPMRRRTEVFTVPPRVLIDNNASNALTVIEINGRDRPGLLYDVTQALTDEGLQISSAHISTFGERVVDVFYVKDVFGLKMDSETKTRAVRNRLLDTIAVDESAMAAE